jgi:hypothetical protein
VTLNEMLVFEKLIQLQVGQYGGGVNSQFNLSEGLQWLFLGTVKLPSSDE